MDEPDTAPVADAGGTTTTSAPSGEASGGSPSISSQAAPPSAAPEASPSSRETSFPSHEEFSWDAWNGQRDALPEHVRGWAEKLEGHYTKSAREREAEAKELREIYESLTNDGQDPRLGQTTAELEAARKELADAKKAHEQELAQYKAWEKQLENLREQESAKYVEDFRAKHGWMFDGGEIEDAAFALLEQGFVGEDLPTVLRLPPALQEKVKATAADLRKQGLSDGVGALAIRIVRSEARFDPSPSEAIQANPANRVTTATHNVPPPPTDFEERRRLAIERANNQLAGRR